MTRIIGGHAKGRRLQAPRGAATRPTSDRVREALFSAIESWGGSLSGLRFLDLYAGSGAVGLEAWSRGAGVVTLVEHDRRTARLIAANAEAIGCTIAQVWDLSVERVLSRVAAAPYDVVFSDPPYDLAAERVRTDLEQLLTNEWIVPGGLLIVERSSRDQAHEWPDGISAHAHKRYGETSLWFGHALHGEDR